MKPIPNPPDPVLESLHETRRQLLQQHGGIAGLAAYLREREQQSDREIKAPPPRTTPGRIRHRGKRS